MKANYIDSILIATDEVLENMLQLKVNQGEIETKEDTISTKKANISISVTGDLKGSILFSFTEDMALEIVKKMSGMEMDELDKFVMSAIGELANIISGKAMTNLHDGDYTCDIAPPQVIIGTDQTISMGSKKILSVPLNTEIGEFEINISITRV
ncbi:chemotaxis protein CheX [Selenihalanaerobacter shriftii]|uniref:Chemotaxis protein CheX n=1 Tax=Selenihalanaerobacter shriftii TaxID=142842 RepID=A0A1T4JKL8_9FIRM|nr:chemotaxis protein CheX [Selenihalanaerobacter shriftii]SJZ30719.1 chemotaxis protein CheX [Selenihalanaerobacter shriftii]